MQVWLIHKIFMRFGKLLLQTKIVQTIMTFVTPWFLICSHSNLIDFCDWTYACFLTKAPKKFVGRLCITFFKLRPAGPSQQCKRVFNNIQDPPPRWILMIFKLKCGGRNLFSPAMTNTIEGNNYVGSLLEPLLKKVTPVVGSRMLCSPNLCTLCILSWIVASALLLNPLMPPELFCGSWMATLFA